MSKSEDPPFPSSLPAYPEGHISKTHIKEHDLLLEAMFSPEQVELIEEVLRHHYTDAADSFWVADQEETSSADRLRFLINFIRAQGICDDIHTALYERRTAIEKLKAAQMKDELQRKHRIYR